MLVCGMEREETQESIPAAAEWRHDTTLRFGRCEVMPRARRLFVGGVQTEIGSRAFDLLLALLERHGQVVGKEELVGQVWPETFVDSSNLKTQILVLRRALGPDRDAVQTVIGRGYRFAADMSSHSLAKVPTSPHNLPDLPPLIGRADALRQLEACVLRDRLVTLVGVGGIGKTRLAVELGRRLTHHFLEGVWLVDLAPLDEPGRIGTAVATVLGVAVPKADQVMEAIVGAIGHRRLLLIFDNCEHLIDAVAEFSDRLLRRASELTLIATSREALRIGQEQAIRLDPLALPPEDADIIEGFGAIDLFVERARAVVPGFALDAANSARVAQICRRVEGIPLALEMAAARVRLLGIDGLSAGINEQLALLKFRPEQAISRHSSLRAVMEWSHDLLDPVERKIFRRLAIFAGSFQLKSVTDVVGYDLDKWEAVDCFSGLIDKSLVSLDGGEPVRYRLLDTVPILCRRATR